MTRRELGRLMTGALNRSALEHLESGCRRFGCRFFLHAFAEILPRMEHSGFDGANR